MWTDLDFADLVMYVRRAYVWGRFKVPKSKASKAPVPMHPLLAGFLLAWRDKTPFGKDTDFVFPSVRLKGKKPLSASIMVQKYLRPAAVKAGVIKEGEKVRFGFHKLPARSGDGAGQTESGCEDRAGDTASRGLRDDYAALRTIGHGVDARGAGQVPGAAIGRQDHLLTERVQ
jgi:hypothetical protein